MKIMKDLLYDKENKHLDISRLCALLGVIGYAGLTTLSVMRGGLFDAFEWGSGWAAVCGGNAAWIFARQRYEAGIAFAPTERKQDQQEFNYYGGSNGHYP